MESKDFHKRIIFTAKLFMDVLGHFGGLPQLIEFWKNESSRRTERSVFDFDWSKPEDPLFMTRVFLALMGIKFNKASLLATFKSLSDGAANESIGLWLLARLNKSNELRKLLDEHYNKHGKLIEEILTSCFAAEVTLMKWRLPLPRRRRTWTKRSATSFIHARCCWTIHVTRT